MSNEISNIVRRHSFKITQTGIGYVYRQSLYDSRGGDLLSHRCTRQINQYLHLGAIDTKLVFSWRFCVKRICFNAFFLKDHKCVVRNEQTSDKINRKPKQLRSGLMIPDSTEIKCILLLNDIALLISPWQWSVSLNMSNACCNYTWSLSQVNTWLTTEFQWRLIIGIQTMLLYLIDRLPQ